MNRRQITLAVALASIVVLVIVAFVLPVPYVIEEPGPVFDTLGTVNGGTTQVVQISGAKTYKSGGHIYLTTVDVDPGICGKSPNLAQAIGAWFNSDDAVIPEQAECPPLQSSGSVVLQDQADMATSQINAEIAALTTLGYKVIGHEVIVSGVEPGTPAATRLRPEDVLTSVDGTRVTSVHQALGLIDGAKVGASLAIDFTRDGKAYHTAITTVAAPTSSGGTDSSKGYIGVDISPRPLFNGVTVNMGINPDDVGGPSAGTALALGIIDKLTPGGITGGRTIAGTGTITAGGKIGEIGGVQQKVAAAANQHATVFFAPSANCADAKSQAPSWMTLVRAETLSEVLQALKDINSGSNSFPHC